MLPALLAATVLAQGPLDSSLVAEIIGGAQKAAQFANLVNTAAALDPRILVSRLIAGALGFVGLIFIARIVYAGFLWFNAQGESEPVKKAQKIIIQSSIGAVFLFSTYGIAKFLQFRLVNAMQENILDAVTTCSGSAGACCQEWANYQNSPAPSGSGSGWSAWGNRFSCLGQRVSGTASGGQAIQSQCSNAATAEKLLQEWKDCRSRNGSWGR